MRIEVKNSTSHKDAPISEIYNAIGVQLFHLAVRWPGAHHVVDDLNDQGFYLNLVDDIPEAPGALGYHSIDDEGRSYSNIAANPSLKNGSDWLTGRYSVASVAGHEALETVCNPIVNIMRDLFDQAGSSTPQEVCDPVEDMIYRHNGVDLSNFVLPSWFNPWAKAPFDYLGGLVEPFQLSPGGYMVVRTGGTEKDKWGSRKGDAMPEWRRNMYRGRVGFLYQ